MRSKDEDRRARRRTQTGRARQERQDRHARPGPLKASHYFSVLFQLLLYGFGGPPVNAICGFSAPQKNPAAKKAEQPQKAAPNKAFPPPSAFRRREYGLLVPALARIAVPCQQAVPALRAPGGAGVPSKENHPVAEVIGLPGRQDLPELALRR